MKSFIFFVCAICVAFSASVKEPKQFERKKFEYKCLVSDWKEWSECNAQKSRNNKEGLQTVKMQATKYDVGREWMKKMMEEKEKASKDLSDCRKAGTCPQLALKASQSRQNCINGMAGEWPCRNVDMLSFVSLTDLGSTDLQSRSNDIWGWTDPETNDEYAIVGLSDGTSFVRVTDPENPVVLGFLRTHRNSRSNWRDMKVVNNHAFIVSEEAGHGMQVFDLTQLRGKTTFAQYQANTHYARVGNSHNIVSHEATNTVFIVGATRGNYPDNCQGGLHIIDVSDPQNPVFAGCFADDGYVHDAECLFYRGPDTRYTGREICFCYNEDTLTIVDVTDRSDIRLIAKSGYTGAAYTHQGWLLEDHTALLLDDEQDEQRDVLGGNTITYFWDIAALDNPILRSTHRSSELAIDHNQYIRDGFTYQSNYEAGLRILKINKDTWSLDERAFFDVYPQVEGQVQFRGTWSNYPYFPSRNVIMTSIEYGLFVVRPQYENLEKENDTGRQSRTREILKSSDNLYCPPLFESRECKP